MVEIGILNTIWVRILEWTLINIFILIDYYPETLMIRNGILKNINDGNSDYDDYQVNNFIN